MEGADTAAADTKKRNADDMVADGEPSAATEAPDAKKAKAAEPETSAQPSAAVATLETEPAASEPNQVIAAAAAAVREGQVIEGVVAGTEAQAVAATQEGAATEGGAAPVLEPETPLTLGFKTFKGGAECLDYYHHLLGTITKDQDLNEYEFVMLSELIKKGHPDAAGKIGAGLRAIQVKDFLKMETTCFFVLRTDGSSDDFSYRKCVANLFPSWDMLKHTRAAYKGGRGGGRGTGGGGDGGRGRGRGGGRGRGDGRGRGGGRGRGRGRGR